MENLNNWERCAVKIVDEESAPEDDNSSTYSDSSIESYNIDLPEQIKFIKDLDPQKKYLSLIYIPSKNYLIYFLKGDYLPKCIDLQNKKDVEYFSDQLTSKNQDLVSKSLYQNIYEYFFPEEDFCTFWEKIKNDIICIGAHLSSEGKIEQFLYVCKNGTLVVYDLKEKKFTKTTMIDQQEKLNIFNRESEIECACFNRDSTQCAFGLTTDRKIRIYNCKTNKRDSTINSKHKPFSIAFNNAGTCLAGSSENGIIFYDLITKKEEDYKTITKKHSVLETAFSPDDGMLFVLITLGYECQMAIYNVKKKTLQKLFDLHGRLEFVIWPKDFEAYAFSNEAHIDKIDLQDFIEDANPEDGKLPAILKEKKELFDS